MSFAPPPPAPPPNEPTAVTPPPPPPPPPIYQEQSFATTGQTPRPRVRVGATLLMVGAITHVVAVFLPWFKYQGTTMNGRDDFITKDLKVLHSPGTFWIFFGALLFGLGLALFLAGRNLAVAIISVVIATIAGFFSLIGIGAAQNMRDVAEGGTIGLGAPLGIVAILIALAGAITALAKRRR